MNDHTADGAHTAPSDHERVELRKESYSMALYVALCLLAALSAVSESGERDHVDVFALVWGTTVGLALAHWLAFRVSARLVAAGRIRPHDAAAAAAQLVAAALVAVLATLPVVLLPRSTEFDVARLVLAGFVGVVGYAVARSSGGTRRRSLVYGATILVIAVAVAVVKNALAGH